MTSSIDLSIISNIAQSMASDIDWEIAHGSGPRIKDCRQCGNKHFTIDKMDELIWPCVESLTHKFTRCNAWQYWLKMRTTMEPTMEEEAICTLAMMAETKAEAKAVGCRILNWGNSRE